MTVIKTIDIIQSTLKMQSIIEKHLDSMSFEEVEKLASDAMYGTNLLIEKLATGIKSNPSKSATNLAQQLALVIGVVSAASPNATCLLVQSTNNIGRGKIQQGGGDCGDEEKCSDSPHCETKCDTRKKCVDNKCAVEEEVDMAFSSSNSDVSLLHAVAQYSRNSEVARTTEIIGVMDALNNMSGDNLVSMMNVNAATRDRLLREIADIDQRVVDHRRILVEQFNKEQSAVDDEQKRSKDRNDIIIKEMKDSNEAYDNAVAEQFQSTLRFQLDAIDDLVKTQFGDPEWQAKKEIFFGAVVGGMVGIGSTLSVRALGGLVKSIMMGSINSVDGVLGKIFGQFVGIGGFLDFLTVFILMYSFFA